MPASNSSEVSGWSAPFTAAMAALMKCMSVVADGRHVAEVVVGPGGEPGPAARSVSNSWLTPIANGTPLPPSVPWMLIRNGTSVTPCRRADVGQRRRRSGRTGRA